MAKLFSASHEWIEIVDGVGTVGISSYAAAALGDITFVEVPALGRELALAESFGVVESVKAASELYAPAAGTVVECNDALENAPETIGEDAEGAGWICKVAVKALDDKLMDAAAYAEFLKQAE